jgi:hypothetical protein
VLGLGGCLGGRPRRVMAAVVEPRGAAAESPNAGGSARDGASASGIGKSRWRRREPAVERRGVAVVEPRGAAAESPDVGGSARDGASAGHGDRGNRRGGGASRGGGGGAAWGGCQIAICGRARSGCLGL